MAKFQWKMARNLEQIQPFVEYELTIESFQNVSIQSAHNFFKQSYDIKAIDYFNMKLLDSATVGNIKEMCQFYAVTGLESRLKKCRSKLPLVVQRSVPHQCISMTNQERIASIKRWIRNRRSETTGPNAEGLKLARIMEDDCKFEMLCNMARLRFCNWKRCKTIKGKLRSCSRCYNVAYCSEHCQQRDWQSHKNVCKASKLAKKKAAKRAQKKASKQ